MKIKTTVEKYMADPNIQGLAALLVGAGGRADWSGGHTQWHIDRQGEGSIPKAMMQQVLALDVEITEYNFFTPVISRSKLEEEVPEAFDAYNVLITEYPAAAEPLDPSAEPADIEPIITRKKWKDACRVFDYGEDACRLQFGICIDSNGRMDMSSLDKTIFDLFIAEFSDFATLGEFTAWQQTFQQSFESL